MKIKNLYIFLAVITVVFAAFSLTACEGLKDFIESGDKKDHHDDDKDHHDDDYKLSIMITITGSDDTATWSISDSEGLNTTGSGDTAIVYNTSIEHDEKNTVTVSNTGTVDITARFQYREDDDDDDLEEDATLTIGGGNSISRIYGK